MNFHTFIIAKKMPGFPTTLAKINIKGITEIEELLPTKEQIAEWAKEVIVKMLTPNQEIDLIHIKVTYDVYVQIIKRLYRKIGKSVEPFQEKSITFRIPTKKGNAFFNEIQRVVLVCDELQAATIVIHV